MNTTDTGGPAFPFTDSASPTEHPGMTLRDYFAAKAMQTVPMPYAKSECVRIACHAYLMADAMLKARRA